MSRYLKALVAILFLVVMPVLSGTSLALDIPYLSGRITDNAELLDATTRRELRARMSSHEQATGNQIAVLTVPTLDGENLEDYANKVFRAWGLGQKDRNNGVLLLVAPAERRLRIEVGYGLEGTLTDLVASRIIQNIITPHFRHGDFNKGISEGVHAIIAQLSGEAIVDTSPAPAPKTPVSTGEKQDRFFSGPDLGWAERLLIGAFIFGIIGLFTGVALFTPGVGWFLYFFLIPFWAMFPIVVIGTSATVVVFLGYLIGFPIAKVMLSRRDWYKKARQDLRSKGRASIGGFTIGSGSSGGSSSWSSGGGGFSGGGGSSGGGGASGSW